VRGATVQYEKRKIIWQYPQDDVRKHRKENEQVVEEGKKRAGLRGLSSDGGKKNNHYASF